MKKALISILSAVSVLFTAGMSAFAAEEQTVSSEAAATVGDTAKIMGQGMLGIFIVMILIYLVIVILNKAAKK